MFTKRSREPAATSYKTKYRSYVEDTARGEEQRIKQEKQEFFETKKKEQQARDEEEALKDEILSLPETKKRKIS